MEPDTNRRDFLRGGALTTAGILAANATAAAPQERPGHEHHHEDKDFPRQAPGRGGPLGSATDRGKLVAGRRGAGEPPVPMETPDLPKLAWKMKDGVKEFHLIAKHTRREFLPGQLFDVWGYNDAMPGPTIEAVEGDRVRFVVHNELPEPTVLHTHGLELPNRFDGVHGLTQDPIMPGKSFAYEFTLHQTGTFFYHSHGPMQEGMGMVGLFVIHPRSAYTPVVDRDFALILQEWAILPQSTIPNTMSMEFNFFTINGRSAPYTTPLVVRLGDRVRIRFLNFSPIDHHPMHLHGHTFWITGTEGGRIPESAWVPGNNVLVGVAQVREVEFIANNPGDWAIHCHMFHHMMNHMTAMVGPMAHHMGGTTAGHDMAAGMGMMKRGPALSEENGPSLGRGMGENTGNERAVRTGAQQGHDHEHGSGHQHGSGTKHTSSTAERHDDPGYKVPGYPQDMMGMHGTYAEAELKRITKPETRGMRKNWYAGLEGLHTVLRVLPADLYDKVVSGKGEVPPGASVPGSGTGDMHHHHH